MGIPEPMAYTLEQASELTGFSVRALTEGCRRAEKGLPGGISHSKLAGVRVMTRAHIQELLDSTAIAGVPTPKQDEADEVVQRRQRARQRVARQLAKAVSA